MHDTLVILDFDHTLFNTTKLVQVEADYFLKAFGISKTVFYATREKVKLCCVVEDIDTFVALLPHPDKAAMHDALLSVIRLHAPNCLFTDVIPFLDSLENTADWRLVTHGDTKLQEAKIRSSGLPSDTSFSIIQDKKSDVIANDMDSYTSILFVDDKPENLREVKNRFLSVLTYLIMRPDHHPYSDSSAVYPLVDHTVSMLEEIQF